MNIKHLSRKITIVLMVLGIIVVAGCNKKDSVKTEDVNENLDLGREGDCSIWEGGKSCTFRYEDEDYEVYLWSRIAFGDYVEFRLEGLPEGRTINMKGGNDYEHSRLTFGENQYVPYELSRKTMDIKLNPSIVSNPSAKTEALFEQNDSCISLHLKYCGDSII